VLEFIITFFENSGFGNFVIGNAIMIVVGCVFIYLAVTKDYEPLLLVPIGFGILIGNIPYDASKLPLHEDLPFPGAVVETAAPANEEPAAEAPVEEAAVEAAADTPAPEADAPAAEEKKED